MDSYRYKGFRTRNPEEIQGEKNVREARKKHGKTGCRNTVRQLLSADSGSLRQGAE